MYSIGTDIVKISRIEKSVKSDHFLKRVFTQKEREYAKKAESLAGIFACKEAYLKALGTGIDRPLNEIEILHTEKGKPYVNGVDNCDVSISHDGEYAIAAAIIW